MVNVKTVMEIAINNLVPFERKLNRVKYNEKVNMLRAGNELPPVNVAIVNDFYVISNGNHRVRACYDLGYSKISYVIEILQPKREAMYKADIKSDLRIQDLPIVDG